VQGKRDADVGWLVHKDGVYPRWRTGVGKTVYEAEGLRGESILTPFYEIMREGHRNH
jgi:hypothetical protein